MRLKSAFFGPGFGESIVIHAGNGEWVIVDSCINSRSGKPARLTYFGEIQVEPYTAVKLIVATHCTTTHPRNVGADPCVHVS